MIIRLKTLRDHDSRIVGRLKGTVGKASRDSK